MSGESGPAVTLITAWERERGPGQGHVLIPLHGMVEEAAVVKISTPRIAVVTHVFAFFLGVLSQIFTVRCWLPNMNI